MLHSVSEVNLVEKSRALNGTPHQSYGLSLAIWDHSHTVLPVTRPTQVNTPRLNLSQRLLLALATPEGWKAELT